MTEWWSGQTAAYIGGLGGGGLGTLCGLLGALAGWLAPRGRCQPLVLGGFGALAIVGVASLVTGLLAWCLGQPYHVWYPLVLTGVLLAVVPGALLPVLRSRYRQAEARRFEAAQLRRR